MKKILKDHIDDLEACSRLWENVQKYRNQADEFQTEAAQLITKVYTSFHARIEERTGLQGEVSLLLSDDNKILGVNLTIPSPTGKEVQTILLEDVKNETKKVDNHDKSYLDKAKKTVKKDG